MSPFSASAPMILVLAPHPWYTFSASSLSPAALSCAHTSNHSMPVRGWGTSAPAQLQHRAARGEVDPQHTRAHTHARTRTPAQLCTHGQMGWSMSKRMSAVRLSPKQPWQSQEHMEDGRPAMVVPLAVPKWSPSRGPRWSPSRWKCGFVWPRCKQMRPRGCWQAGAWANWIMTSSHFSWMTSWMTSWMASGLCSAPRALRCGPLVARACMTQRHVHTTSDGPRVHDTATRPYYL